MTQAAPDIVAHRDWLTSLVELPATGKVLDLGCGAGHDVMALARRSLTGKVQYLGVDRSAQAIAEATARLGERSDVAFEVLELTATLPWSDAPLDVVFSNNYLECVTDVPELVKEVARILRPGGQVVFGQAAADEIDAFLTEQEGLAATRRYCYSITGYAYVGRRA